MPDRAPNPDTEALLVQQELERGQSYVTPGGMKYWPALDAFRKILAERDALAARLREAEEALREACLHQGLPADAQSKQIAAHFRNNREYREGWDALAASSGGEKERGAESGPSESRQPADLATNVPQASAPRKEDV
jgi:hypothetical protein